MEASQRSKKFNRIICSCSLFLQFMILNLMITFLSTFIHTHIRTSKHTWNFTKKHQREQLLFLVKVPLKFYDLAPRNGYMSFQRHILCFLFNQIIFIMCFIYLGQRWFCRGYMCKWNFKKFKLFFFTCYFSRFLNPKK